MSVKFKGDDKSLTAVEVITAHGDYTVVQFTDGVLRRHKATVRSSQIIGDEQAVETKAGIDQTLANIQVDANQLMDEFDFDKFIAAGVKENAVDDFQEAHRVLMQTIHNMQVSRVLKLPSYKKDNADKADAAAHPLSITGTCFTPRYDPNAANKYQTAIQSALISVGLRNVVVAKQFTNYTDQFKFTVAAATDPIPTTQAQALLNKIVSTLKAKVDGIAEMRMFVKDPADGGLILADW